MADGTIAFESGIDLAAVRAEIARARQAALAGMKGTVRACTLYLAGVFDSAAGAAAASAGLAQIANVHPARVVVLVSDAAAPGTGVRAEVRVEAHGAVTREFVTITANGAATRHLRAALEGLAVAEMPFAVYWPGEPAGALFERALATADRVVLDSGRLGPARTALRRLLPLLDDDAPLGDLAWARLAGWQGVAADVLDLPALREHRSRVRTAEIRHLAGACGVEAALLGGWLASRLRDVRVSFIEAPGEGAPGALAGLTMTAPPATFRFQVEGGRVVADVEGDDDGPAHHAVRLPPSDLGHTLARELELFSGRDELYEAALRSAVSLVGG